MKWRDVPGIFRKLVKLDTVENGALRFVILTAARTDEVIGKKERGKWTKAPATWAEIGTDEEGKPVWVRPGNRMKARERHRVPLTPPMVALLGKRSTDETPLFRVRSMDSMRDLLRSLTGNGDTVHGLRTSFRTWVAEATDYTKDLGELCLAHDNRSKVERAYQRSDLLEKRREIMEAWSGYVAG